MRHPEWRDNTQIMDFQRRWHRANHRDNVLDLNGQYVRKQGTEGGPAMVCSTTRKELRLTEPGTSTW